MKDLGTPTSRIIDELYAGTLDDTAWKRALLDIADLVSARDALLFVINPRTRSILRAELQRVDPGTVFEYSKHWFERDIRFAPGLRIPVGEPQFEARLLPLRDWKRSEVYGDFLRPNDSPFFLRTWLHKGPEKLASLSLQATCGRGPFDEHDAERIRPLVPHVQRALEIKDRLERAQVRADTLSTSFDSLGLGVMILDGAGRLLEANAAAQRAMRAGTAMHLDADRHLHLGGSAGADLARWIANGRPPEHLRDGLVHVARPSGQPFSVMVTRLPEIHTAWIGGDPRWMLLLFDPDARTRASAELIARDLCISEREAELAALLAAGHDLHRVAALLGITINTARAHLKAIFSKTDIHSQAELVRRVVAGPSVIGGGTR